MELASFDLILLEWKSEMLSFAIFTLYMDTKRNRLKLSNEIN